MPSNHTLLSLERVAFATGLAGLLMLAPVGGPLSPVPAARAADEIAEIVVSVREREESLKNVPGTVSVLTSEQIEASGIDRAKDFIALTPGVSIVNAAEVADSQVNIRGMNGARDAEPNYGLIIDGILMTNPAALNREYLNLRQIEVLKGPQGALYGRNAAAGAFIITTNKPGDKWGADLKARGAGDNSYYIAGDVGGPLTDTLKINFEGHWRKSDGFYKNAYFASLGQNDHVVDYDEDYSHGLRLIWDPTDKLDLDAKVRYNKVKAGSITFNSVFHIPAATGFSPYWAENVNGHDFLFPGNIKPTNNQDAFEASLKGTYNLGWADLTAWTLYSDVKNDLSSDGTSAAFGFFNNEPSCKQTTAALGYGGSNFKLSPPQFIGLVPDSVFGNPSGSVFGAYTPTTCDGTQYQVRNQKDFSVEVRLASKSDQRLRWLGGAYFLHIDREVGVNLGLDRGLGVQQSLFIDPTNYDPIAGTGPLNPTIQLVDDQFNTNVVSGFGQLAFDIVKGLEASLALRYDVERREVKNQVPTGITQNYVAACPGAGPWPLNPGQCSGAIAPKAATFTELEPKVALNWLITDNISTFASIGRGFKSGGFNSQGSKETIDTFINCALGLGAFGGQEGCGAAQPYSSLNIGNQYKKETSWAFEVGQKSDWFSRRVSTTAAVYYTDVKDMQFFEFVVGPFGLLRTVSNIDKVQIYGAELGASWVATDWLSFTAGGNYTHSEIKKNSARPDTIGNKSPYTPDWTATAGARFSWPLSKSLNFVVNADMTAIGDTWFSTVQTQPRPTLFGFASDMSLAQRKPYAIMNMRAGFEGPNWSILGFVNNVSDEKYLEEVIPAPEFGGSFIHPGSQSRVGLEVGYKF
jgi:iron complex outermembrane receptor protein